MVGRGGGELDEANASTLEALVQPLDGNKPIALDFSDLEFMGAAGIEVLLRLSCDHQRGGGSITVVRCSEPVKRLLAMCGLDAAEHPYSAKVPSTDLDALGGVGLRV